MGRVWEWKVERGMGRGGAPTRNLNGKGIQDMVFSQLRMPSLIILNCENPSVLQTHCMHLQGMLFFIS